MNKYKAVYVYDISAMVHAGTKAVYSSKFNFNGFPTGGIRKVLQYIIDDMRFIINNVDNTTGKLAYNIIACFDSPTHKLFKTSIYPNFKGSRKLDNSLKMESFGVLDKIHLDELNIEIGDELLNFINDVILSQNNCIDIYNISDVLGSLENISVPDMLLNGIEKFKECSDESLYEEYKHLPFEEKKNVCEKWAVGIQLKFLEKWLPLIGINCLHFDGLEADDIIYSIANHYKDSNVYIRGDDLDLVDCILLNENTNIWSIRGGTNYNSEALKDMSGKLVNNVIHGKKNDMPVLEKKYPKSVMYRFRNIMTGEKKIIRNEKELVFNPILVRNPDFTINYEYIKQFIFDFDGYNEEMIKDFTDNIYLTYPFIIKLDDYLKQSDLNYDLLQIILSMFRMDALLKKIGRNVLIGEGLDYIRKYYTSKVPLYYKIYLDDKYFGEDKNPKGSLTYQNFSMDDFNDLMQYNLLHI